MQKLIAAGFFLMTLFSFSALAAEAPTSVTRLPNGLTVMIKKDSRFPLVSLRLYVHAGSAYETPEQAGISHFLEHMVFKGTEKRPKGAVAAEVESSGGYLNAATSFDYTVYQTDMTKEHWKLGLDVLKDMAFHPSLLEEDMGSEKDVVIAEMKRGEDTPGQRLFRMSQAAALKGTPYERPIIGFEPTVRAVTPESIRDYISKFYQPQSMLLLICGDVDEAEALAEAQKLFSGLSNTHSIQPPAMLSPAPQGFQIKVEEGPWNKVHLAVALPAPSQTDARAPQLDVLCQILGGDASSRFYRLFKYEKRLVDSISISNYSFERTGIIYIQASLDAEKLSAFWELLVKEIAALPKAAFSREEVDRAKLNIEDELYRSKETLAEYASKLGYFAFFDRGEEGEENYLLGVRSTDQESLLSLIREDLNLNAASASVLLPKGTKPPKGEESFAAFATQKVAAAFPPKESGKTAQADAAPQKPEVIDLGQNRTLILLPDTTLPYTSVTMMFAGGDSLLSPKEQGLGAFTASLLTKGTQKLSATEMEEYQSDRASSLSAASGRQYFTLSVNSPKRFTGDMLGLLTQTLVTPAMKEEEAARVKENQIAAVTAREDQPTGLAFRRMFPFLFGPHPYGYLALGEKDSISGFTAKDAKAFWKDQTLRPWVLSVCGDFDREKILEAAKKLPQPAKEAPIIAPPKWTEAGKELDLSLPERNQAHLFMVFPIPGTGTEDEAGLDLLQNILAGQSGLLFRDLRDVHGLGYTVTAFSWKAPKTGALIFYIGTDPEKITQAKDGFVRIVGELRQKPLDAAELERGKNQMAGDYYREHQSLDSRGGEAAILTAEKRPLSAARDLVDKAQTLTPEDIQKLSEKYLNTDAAYIVKVLP